MKTPAAYIRFRAALAADDLESAMAAARALPGLLSLLDALELVLLIARDEVGRANLYDECAARWLARVTAERGIGLDDLVSAGQTLQEVRKGDAPHAYGQLAALL